LGRQKNDTMKRLWLVPVLLVTLAVPSCYGQHRIKFTIRAQAPQGEAGPAPSIGSVAEVVGPVALGLGFQSTELLATRAHWRVLEQGHQVDIEVEESKGAIVVILVDGSSGVGWWSASHYRAARVQLGKQLRSQFGEANVTTDA
jgi:hypothetical protein